MRFPSFIPALAFLAHEAGGQQTSSDSARADRLAPTSVEFWAGYSPGSTSAGFLGRHGGVTLGLAAFRFNHRVRVSERRSLYYTFDLIPVARVTPLIEYKTASGQTIPGVLQCAPPAHDCNRIAMPARGIGFNPLGWTAVFGGNRVAQWRLGATAGALMFDRPAPSDLAARFNFTAAIETGVQLVKKNGSGLLMVYRLHHLSNAGTAEDNLALLSHVISIGGIWRTGKR
jgi:hypothetical protein